MVVASNTQVTEAALALADRGLAVFRCHSVQDGKCTCGKDCASPGKHPATPNGFKGASKDASVIEAMFTPSPDCNVAIATGQVSGIWVLDVEAEGIKRLDQLELQYGRLPETVSVITGGGGRHVYFQWDGTPIRNKARIGDFPIDVRGEGGYVIAPPSLHSSGKTYSWERDPDTTALAKAPPWLVDLVTGKTESYASINQGQTNRTFFTGNELDITSHPGAAKGERHNVALRLIGAAVGRGQEIAQITPEAVDWARRCTPPMDEKEITRMVSDLYHKQAKAIDLEQDQVEREPLPPSVPWPVLEADALHGLAGEIVRTLEPQTEADPAGILVQVLLYFGNVIGRSPYFLVEGTKHHTNMFAVVVGSTARGRKGTSEGRVREIFQDVDEEWLTDRRTTGLVSGEGLIWGVRDSIFKLENFKEKGRIVATEEVLADAGVDDKRLLVVESEFATVLRVSKREQNTLSPTLRSAWDTGNLRTMAKNSPAKATKAHISVIGHITKEELRQALPEVEGFSGFGNRFLWVAVRRSKLLPNGGQDLDLSSFVTRLKQVTQFAKSVGRMSRDAAAEELWHRIYWDLANESSTGLVAAMTSRAEAQVLRLSMAYALLDCSAIIREVHLRAAYAVWRYCQASARLIFGNVGKNPLQEKVLETIWQFPGGITRWELHKRVCRHKPAKAIIDALVQLRDTGRIRMELITTAGRPAETWFPVRQTWQTALPDRGGQSEEHLSDITQQRGNALPAEDFDGTGHQFGGLTYHISLTSGPYGDFEEIRI